MEYSQTNPICSTSWATTIIEIAKSITGKIFSVDQLLQCLPKQENIDGCQGVHPKTLATYLSEEGLVEMKDFTDCESLEEKTHYHFAAVYPSSPNAGGLMNLIAEGIPVFAMVAFDLVKLRFVKDVVNNDEKVNCATYQPSMYGIVSAYQYNKDFMEDSYWEIVSHIVPCEEMRVRVPMTRNMTNSNYGGIAAFAFTLQLKEITSSTISTLTPTPTPTLDAFPEISDFLDGNLHITKDEECHLILYDRWITITVEENLCNDIDQELYLLHYLLLESIIIKKGSFQNVPLIDISNHPNLHTFICEDGINESQSIVGSFKNTKSFFMDRMILFLVKLLDNPMLHILSFGAYSFANADYISLSGNRF